MDLIYVSNTVYNPVSKQQYLLYRYSRAARYVNATGANRLLQCNLQNRRTTEALGCCFSLVLRKLLTQPSKGHHPSQQTLSPITTPRLPVCRESNGGEWTWMEGVRQQYSVQSLPTPLSLHVLSKKPPICMLTWYGRR